MTDTEAKALANELRTAVTPRAKISRPFRSIVIDVADHIEATEARHAAEMRELKKRFGEAVEAYGRLWSKRTPSRDEYTAHFAPFILPAPDPLVEVIRAMALSDATQDDADRLRAAMQARGYEWRKIGEAGE